jgi:hypothetical protein
MAWPKLLIFPDGLKVEVESWEEIREARAALGVDVQVVGMTGESERRSETRLTPSGAHGLTPHDRSLLEQFVDAGDRGALTQALGQAIGARGKGVRPALDRWARQIGLVTAENVSAFQAVKRFDGRGLRMVEHYRRAASQMLGR